MFFVPKGVSESVISRISHIYQDSITIPVVNNVLGNPLQNIRGSLRQGCPGSMGWLGVAIDPLLIHLDRILSGIPICSLPTLGPCLIGGSPPEPVTELYTVFGFADDVKPGVTSTEEFVLVDNAARLFELSSGCFLHRDPLTGKCKALPLGKWRKSLQQNDIGLPYLKLSDRLSMVGVELTATWQSTRKLNNDDLLDKVQKCIGSWRSGKFLPLVCRPFSINTFYLSKVWFRSGSVDLRAGDISAINSKIKSYCYQDMYQKPSEVLLFRTVEEGGLGLHHLQSKAQAHLIATFLQTVSGSHFQQSLFHSWLYRYHIESQTQLPDPGYTPYYDKKFFTIIKEVEENSPLNPLYLTIKEWYNLLLKMNVTMHKVDQEDRFELIPCKVEEREPTFFWSESYRISRLLGLSPDSKSFLFKLIHTLLPSKERLHHLTPAISPSCWCAAGATETYHHLFFECSKNKEAGQALLTCIKSYNRDLSPTMSLRLELTADDPFLLPSVALLSAGLELIWERRKTKKRTALYEMRSELELAVSIRRRSRSRTIREAADIMLNMIVNFFG